jgi:hypothetical protein
MPEVTGTKERTYRLMLIVGGLALAVTSSFVGERLAGPSTTEHAVAMGDVIAVAGYLLLVPIGLAVVSLTQRGREKEHRR